MPALFGCTNYNFVEFNLDANIDDGSCQTTAFYGCSDSTYLEYSSNVNVDDGSCITPKIYGCTDALYLEYLESANTDDGSCNTLVVEGCTNSSACNYSSNANFDDNSCFYSDAYYDCDGNCYTDENGDCYYLNNIIDSINENYISSLSSLQQALDTWNTTIDLSAGWNMFGYGCPSSINVADGLSNHTESIIITKDNNGNVYMPEFGFNGIGDFTPGFGYQIKLTEVIEGFSLCDWNVNDIPEDNIVSLQEENTELNQQIKCLTNPEIGDFCFGGIIFYMDSTNEYGLVMAEEDVNGLYEWGCHNQTDNISFTNSIGLGYENSINISENNCLELGELSAAEAALNFQSNSYNDWYLPSNKELITIYDSLDVISLGFENSYYWSSSPSSSNDMSYCIQPILGYTANIQSTTNTFKVRPIRAFGNWTMGCIDETACNFSHEANMADGSCEYPEQNYDCDGVIEIGVIAYGGIVFYVDESGQHGLVAAMEDLEGFYEWGCEGSDINGDNPNISPELQNIGSGLQNTSTIVSGCSQTPIAASEALAYESGGYDDWYLPSSDEFIEMYYNIGNGGLQGNIAGFDESNNAFYWTSTEGNNGSEKAWVIEHSFNDGQGNHNKSNTYRARVIRSF